MGTDLGDGTGLIYLYMVFMVFYWSLTRNTTSLNTFNMGQMDDLTAYQIPAALLALAHQGNNKL